MLPHAPEKIVYTEKYLLYRGKNLTVHWLEVSSFVYVEVSGRECTNPLHLWQS
jgi:hypothetical protein